MPSLHVAWATWCATAIVITTGSRWRHLAWTCPAAITLIMLASANHLLLHAADGLSVTGPGKLAAAPTLLARDTGTPRASERRPAPAPADGLPVTAQPRTDKLR
jgi:hypothetical protein